MKYPALFIFLAAIALLGSCAPIENNPPLSAGATATPNTNYSVTKPGSEGYEEPHCMRVGDPYFKLKPGLRAQVPVQLRPHSRLLLDDIEDRPFFDYFSWQTFVGLVWPADSAYRGAPNLQVDAATFAQYNTTDATKPNRVPVVFETFRTMQTAYGDPYGATQPAQPPGWNAEAYSRPFSLDLTSKFELDEAFSSPLIDQNHRYLRYGLQMNEVLYEFIRQNGWYLKENLPKSPTVAQIPPLEVDANGVVVDQPQTNTIVMQPVNGNSIELKTAWRWLVTDSTKSYQRVDDLSRYFVSYADIRDPVTDEILKNQPVGLVGIHIVVKTPQFSQGIWASFEHVDNLSTPEGSGIRPSLHDESDTFYPRGFSYQPSGGVFPPEEKRVPVEVSRIFEIPATPEGTSPTLQHGISTQGLNAHYQELLAGTVWQYYQLVITQWPTDPTSFYAKPFIEPRGVEKLHGGDSYLADAYTQILERSKRLQEDAYPRLSGLPIPQVGCLNTTMETYFQNPNYQVKNPAQMSSLESSSCMGCHYGASDMDYSWSLKLRAWPQPFNQGRISPTDTVRAYTVDGKGMIHP